MKPKVSIIVTTFNSCGMVNDAINSLQNQTLLDIEIIVINDSSDDKNDDAIIKRKMEEDKRIIYKKNKLNIGTGACREIGVQLASGEYIGFLDCDDYACPWAYFSMYSSAIENNADIAVSAFKNINTRGFNCDEIPTDKLIYTCSGERLYKLQLNRIKMPYYLRVDWWNKIYKKDLFTTNKITFPHVRRHEGFMSTVMSLLAKQVVVLGQVCFYSYMSKDSVSRHFKKSNIYDTIDATLHIKFWLEKLGYYEKFQNIFIDFSMHVILNLNLKRILYSDNLSDNLKLLAEGLQDIKVRSFLFEYLSRNDRDCETIVLASLLNSQNIDTLKKIKNTDFFYRIEEGGMHNRSKATKPIVTIITITKNLITNGRKKLFEKMVNSVLGQSYGYNNIEHIVIDGKSNDDTLKIFQELYNAGKLTRYISENDTGIYNAMNKGLLYSSGDYILFLNSDDMIGEKCIEKMVEHCENNGLDYVFSDVAKIDLNDKVIGSHMADIDKVYFGTPYCHQALLCSKRCYEEISYSEDFKLTMWSFAIELYENKFTYGHIPEKLAFFRSCGLSSGDNFVLEQKVIKSIIADKLKIKIEDYEILSMFIRRINMSSLNFDEVCRVYNIIKTRKTLFSIVFLDNFCRLIIKNKKKHKNYSLFCERTGILLS